MFKHDYAVRFIFALFVISFCSGLQAQEYNHWLNMVGSRSNMLAGAVTAGVRDNSAIFYNPGGLAFIKNSSLSVTSDGYYLGNFNAKNAAGTNLDLKSSTLDGLPQIVSLIQKVPKLPISVTLAVLNRNYVNVRTSYRHTMQYDVLPENEGNEFYIGSYSYYSKIREDWAGFGYGKEIAPGVGLGVSTFFSYRSQSYYLNQSADVYSLHTDTSQVTLLSNTRFTDELEYRAVGVIFIIGVTYTINAVNLGLNVTLPRINLGFASKSQLKRDIFSNIPSKNSQIFKASMWQLQIPSRFYSPLTVDLGADFQLNDKGILYSKVSFFSPVKRYKILKEDIDIENDFDGIFPPELANFDNMILAYKPVLNVAIAIQQHVSENLEGILGFRTDFNYFDENSINVNTEFVPGKLFVNLYHISGGALWKTEKYDLSLGGSFSFGYKKNELQYVNLSDPTIDNFLFGQRQEISNPIYTQVGVFLGFTYFFPRM